MTSASRETVLTAARQFLAYLNKSPSPYHVVEESKKRLLAAGFQELREADKWDIKPLSKYFVTRNKSSIIAFAVGGKYTAGQGFSIIGAHTDSPCLKVKPIAKKAKQGYLQVGVECYGGGIWATWFDRDLTVAGRVIVKNGDKLDHRLVHIEKPILRVPNLAIHLNREMNTSFTFNKETHLAPVLATCVQEELVSGSKTPESSDVKIQADKHHSLLVNLICDELSIKPEQIVDFELCLADTQPATIGGALDEFIFGPRLDNLFNSYTALQALVSSCDNGLTEDANIRMIALFDNEEVGSQSAQGAGSTLLELVLRRLSCDGSDSLAFERAMPKSYMLSADQAHAVHPNYGEKHEDQHRPALHKGIVVKINSNQRYATTAITSAILRQIAEKANVPLQDFVVRNDSPCGSTIGPIMSAKLGMPTLDIGGPQLSMHSIREMCCTSSVHQALTLYQAFFEKYPAVYSSLNF